MSEASPRDAILIPVHNRRETTLACLQALAADGVFAWAQVLVIDDGSTDGTAEAMRARFPAVHQLRGDGTWWWGGAIRRGMEWALARGAERIFWLNDDCLPPPGGLAALRAFVEQDGVVAWIEARAPGGWSYGGHRRTWMRVRRCAPDEEKRGEIETFNGNCVGLARTWIDRVGLPHDHLFPHGFGDFDYGLRLHRCGARLRALPGFIATSGAPSPAWAESWRRSPRSMREIWRDFSSPRSFLYFPAWRRFALRYWGPLWGWVVFGAPYARWASIAIARTVSSPIGRGTNSS